jgi:hypothetical protein
MKLAPALIEEDPGGMGAEGEDPTREGGVDNYQSKKEAIAFLSPLLGRSLE